MPSSGLFSFCELPSTALPSVRRLRSDRVWRSIEETGPSRRTSIASVLPSSSLRSLSSLFVCRLHDFAFLLLPVRHD